MKTIKLILIMFFSGGVLTASSLAQHAEEVVTEIEGLQVTIAKEENPATGIETTKEPEPFPAPIAVNELIAEEVPVENSEDVVEVAATPAVPQIPQTISSSRLQRIGEMVHAENYENARTELIAVLPSLTGADLDKAKDQLAQVNTKLIEKKGFAFPGITEHVVQRGESLYVIAKRYKTTSQWIAELNNVKDTIIYPDQKLKVATEPISIRISKSKNRLEMYLGEEVIRTYLVATGENGSTPTGDFTVVNKLEDPTWYKTGAVVPPGDKENILGTRWLGFSIEGYGIHGTTIPESIGTQSTAGCIRMLNPEVEDLYRITPTGSHVIIAE